MKPGSIRRTVLCGLAGTLILTGSVCAERWNRRLERRREGQKYISLVMLQWKNHSRPFTTGCNPDPILRPDSYWENLERIRRQQDEQRRRNEYFSYR